MAAPRVFVSSTYYDLKHIRSSLENFIKQLGYDPIRFEKGDIAFTHEQAIDQSCYREARNSDIFVLIIGGRYGSEKSDGKQKTGSFFESYDSITKQEFKSAVDEDIPIYILIDKAVHAEYQTYLKNKDNEKISYAHVDSANVFRLIEEILGMSRNNPVKTFDRYQEIEAWLRVQWAGLFRELLNRKANQNQLASLSGQINELAENNKTLKTYLEKVMTTVADPEESKKLIDSESERRKIMRQMAALKVNPLTDYLERKCGIGLTELLNAATGANSLSEFIDRLTGCADDRGVLDELITFHGDQATTDFAGLKKSLEAANSLM